MKAMRGRSRHDHRRIDQGAKHKAAVFALATVNVAVGTQSFAFAGLLAELAADVGSQSACGGSMLAAGLRSTTQMPR
jgi:thioredoxin-like negative regulator of GroEL